MTKVTGKNERHLYLQQDSWESGDPAEEGQIIRLSRGEIKPRQYQDICGVCGRTLLVGETPELYLEPQGVKPVVVCPVCRSSVRDAGFSKAS